MREYLCTCMSCNKEQIQYFNEPFPLYGELIVCFCKNCNKETSFMRVLTRKALAELRAQQEEDILVKRIEAKCRQYGFTYRPLYQSIVIQTPLSEWSFNYHEKTKTVLHESTYPYNLKTGTPAKAHIQFKDVKMTIEEIIDYIAKHDGVKPMEIINDTPWEAMTPEEKKLSLYLTQKHTLDCFLERCAISQAQYEKSLGDLTEKMGMKCHEEKCNEN